jgi:hypothetical protein
MGDEARVWRENEGVVREKVLDWIDVEDISGERDGGAVRDKFRHTLFCPEQEYAAHARTTQARCLHDGGAVFPS